MKQVFLSYSSDDYILACKLNAKIKGYGYAVWMDRDGIVGGDEFVNKIQIAIEGSIAIVVIITENSTNSIWIPKEIGWALAKRKEIIPLKFTEGNIPFELNNIQSIKFTEKPGTGWRQSCEKLKSALEKISSSPDETILPSQPPAGWGMIDQLFINNLNEEMTRDSLIDYFDGGEPTWKHAVTLNISKCSKTESIASWFEDSRVSIDNKPTKKGIVLLGPGGEGKTTTIMQVLATLVRHDDLSWKVLWRFDNTRPFPTEYINHLPKNEGTVWLIATDNAERIAKDVYDFAGNNDREDIQYFISARDTDLIKYGARDLDWENLGINKQDIGKINIQDAEKVVTSWPDKKDLPSLSGMSIADAAKELVRIAVTDPAKQSTLYGAILSIRTGEGHKDRIERLINTFKDQKIPGSSFTLLDAYICIALAQADNIQPQLPREVLSDYLGISPRDIQSKVIEPLGKEIHVHSNFIYCRHRSLAEATQSVMVETNSLNKAQIYTDLLDASFSVFKYDDSALRNWKYIWQDFKHTDADLAMNLAKFTYSKFPSDERLFVTVSRLLRENKQPEQSINLIAQNWKVIKKDRAVWSEWGSCEATTPLNRHDKGAWLQGISLSDIVDGELDGRRIGISLVQLAINFWELWKQSNNEIYLSGCYSSAELGLSRRGSLDKNGVQILQTKKMQAKEDKRKNSSIAFSPNHINSIKSAVIGAWNMVDASQRSINKKAIPPASELQFNRLSGFFKPK